MTLNRSNLCWLALGLITAGYLVFWAFLLGATATYSTPESWLKVLMSPEIRHATWLSLVTCSLAAGFALLLAVPVESLRRGVWLCACFASAWRLAIQPTHQGLQQMPGVLKVALPQERGAFTGQLVGPVGGHAVVVDGRDRGQTPLAGPLAVTIHAP